MKRQKTIPTDQTLPFVVLLTMGLLPIFLIAIVMAHATGMGL